MNNIFNNKGYIKINLNNFPKNLYQNASEEKKIINDMFLFISSPFAFFVIHKQSVILKIRRVLDTHATTKLSHMFRQFISI